MSLDIYIDGSDASLNVTHNLGAMAREASIYTEVWHPEEVGITQVSQMIPVLISGLKLLESDPGRFKIHNPGNGWGDYDNFVQFLSDYLIECVISDPSAAIRASR